MTERAAYDESLFEWEISYTPGSPVFPSLGRTIRVYHEAGLPFFEGDPYCRLATLAPLMESHQWTRLQARSQQPAALPSVPVVPIILSIDPAEAGPPWGGDPYLTWGVL